jgi:hypothetical protein
MYKKKSKRIFSYLGITPSNSWSVCLIRFNPNATGKTREGAKGSSRRKTDEKPRNTE